MSKKSRRERKPNLMPEAFGAPAQQAQAAAKAQPTQGAAGKAGQASSPGAVAKIIDWSTEYGGVIKELRATLIYALILGVAMAALSLIIR